MSDDAAVAVEGVLGAAQRSLGRLYIPNPGSRRFGIRDELSRSALSSRNWKSKQWRMGKGQTWQDQGAFPVCVQYACTHLLQLQAIVRADAFSLTTELYRWAQQNDGWPGEAYDGTSVDAGLQWLLHQGRMISAYHWCFSMDDVLSSLSSSAAEGGGPLVVGTDFYSGMGNINGDGRWSPTGEYWGGHAWVVYGHLIPTARREGFVRCGNSHAGNHTGLMSYDELEWLLFAQNGEAARVLEIRP